MKIPKNSNQFIGHTAWLIVSGSREAVLYKASDGLIEKIDFFEVKTPKGLRDEGVVMRRGGGHVIDRGTPLEDHKELNRRKAMSDFVSLLKDRLVKNISDKDELYFFVPKFMEGEVLSQLPKKIQKSILIEFSGNYIKKHPLDLIKKINKEISSKKVISTSPEASKILKKAKQGNK